MKPSTVLLALLVLFTAPLQAANLPSGFSETRIASGLTRPTAMAFAPDGRLFIAEQNGAVRILKNGTLLPAPFVTLTVNSSGERGVLGLAFDPNFASNGFVYIYYTSQSAVANRVGQFRAVGDVSDGTEISILNLPQLSATNHNGGAIHFGPDGKLYVAVGDNAVSANSQSMLTPLGKILRINSDGSIPADNPFFSTTSGTNRAIWALGLRNPYNFAFDPGNGRMLINDVGQSSWEEINEGSIGANYGWPNSEGPTTDSRYRSPVYSYNHSHGCSIIGATFYRPPTVLFPGSFVGKYFFGDYCDGYIKVLDPATGAATDFASGISGLVDIATAPDGALYYLARGSGSSTGSLFRVAYSSPSVPTTGPSRLINVSSRALVGTGDRLLIAGFVVGGSGTKKLLVRGVGPTLSQFAVQGVLQNPRLSLTASGGGEIASNDDWGTAPNQSELAAASQATGLVLPAGSRDSAMIVTVPPGGYTALVSGVGDSAGVALVEVYDLEPDGTARLINLSTRAYSGTGSETLVAGFVVSGSGSKKLLVRAAGPALNAFGVSGTLSDPTLELTSPDGSLLASNTDWNSGGGAAEVILVGNQVGAFPYATGSRDAALVTTRPSGAFTGLVKSAVGENGLCLVEVYEAP